MLGLLAGMAVSLALPVVAVSVAEQDFPSTPIRIIAPFLPTEKSGSRWSGAAPPTAEQRAGMERSNGAHLRQRMARGDLLLMPFCPDPFAARIALLPFRVNTLNPAL